MMVETKVKSTNISFGVLTKLIGSLSARFTVLGVKISRYVAVETLVRGSYQIQQRPGSFFFGFVCIILK